MDFPVEVPYALRCPESIVRIDAASFQGSGRAQNGTANLAHIVTTMGKLSASAQKLPTVITTADKLKIMPHRLYMLREWNASQPRVPGVRVLGFIKVGEKKLFLYDERGKMHEVTATCVLDFYVHESCQRHGHGRALFDAMTKREGIASPVQLAIDRPSHKFTSFLEKHFGLRNPLQQSNNFVVFKGFFDQQPAGPRTATAPPPSATVRGSHMVVPDTGRGAPYPNHQQRSSIGFTVGSAMMSY
eukprot:m.22870 g.22870  ORF g.22870 m.22870 type:complete len:244 (-) comp12823_c0_seq2:74-805(-)